MVDFARVQNRIYYGYGKAATRLGTSHAIYRSANGIDPIQQPNFLFNQLISVDENLKYTKAKKYGDMQWQFLPENGLLLQNYDYMVSPSGIHYFIVDIIPDDRLTPPTCVECNAIISLFDLSNTLNPGGNPYQQFPGDKTTILSNCPAAVMQYTRMDMDNMRLPTSVKMPTYSILVPDFDDVVIKSGQEIEDDKGRHMVVIVAEQTKKNLGLRIIAQLKGV